MWWGDWIGLCVKVCVGGCVFYKIFSNNTMAVEARHRVSRVVEIR